MHVTPLTFLVEAADDICYTIIDFEDGINLGLIPEEKALEYMLKLVPHMNKKNYSELTTRPERVGYLRALAIGTLIDEAAETFMENEEAILKGAFAKALLDKSKYEAQIADILAISISNIYQSPEVVEKEIAGYEVLSSLLDARCNAIGENVTHYDKLIIKLFDEVVIDEGGLLYTQLMQVCNAISIMTDGKSLRIFQKLRGLSIN